MEYKENNKGAIIIAIVFLIVCFSIVLVTIGARKASIKSSSTDQVYEGNLAEEDSARSHEELTALREAEPVEETIVETKSEGDYVALNYKNKTIDWDSYQSQNQDVYAWIYVPSAAIDYPILQSAADENYYLDHNIDGSEGYPGCIYTQGTVNSKDFDDPNTIIYGHNMKNGTMFANLHYFKKKSFFSNNLYFYIYTPEGTVLTYEIFACYQAENTLISYQYDFNTKQGVSDYIQSIKAVDSIAANLDAEIINSLNSDSKIVTLSTCYGHNQDNRLLVQGVLVNKEYL